MAEKTTVQHTHASRNLWSGLLFGIGLMAFVDEAVFHQLLHWHHFYDRATLAAGLVSDGFLHAFNWFSAVGGLFLLADLRRRDAWWKKRWLASVLIGAGGFQLFDGIIDHKVLRIHQIRYNVDLLPYDLTWNIAGAVILFAGIFLLNKSRNQVKAGSPDE